MLVAAMAPDDRADAIQDLPSPIAEMIRRQLAVSAETPPDEVRQRLTNLVDGCCDPSEREQVAALDRVDYPAGNLYVAVPTGTTEAGPVPGGHAFGSWLIVERGGPFRDRDAVLSAVSAALQRSRAALRGPVPAPLAGWFDLNLSVVCKSGLNPAAECVTE